MKTKFILFLLLFSSAMFAQEVKRVAILETVDKENKVSYANKLILRASLSKAITQTEGYEAYDRTDVDAIMSEQDFQRTGMVSNDQIKRLGEMTGANYILVAEAALVDSKNMFITAKLLDVETARTIMTDYVMMGTTADAIQEGCSILSEKLFSNTQKSTSSKVAANTSTSQIPQMSANIENGEKLVINSKSTQKMFGVKKYSYGTTQMDEKAFCEFLYKNNRELYLKYMQNQQMIYSGWGLFGGGVIMTLAGGLSWLGGDVNIGVNLGIPLLVFGGAGTITGISLLSVGYTRQKKDVVNMFNAQNAEKPAVTLNLQASQNGVGLALNF